MKRLRYKLQDLWYKLFGLPRATELVVTGDVGKFELDNDTPTRVQQEIGRLMGEAMVGHPYEECEERGCGTVQDVDDILLQEKARRKRAR